MRITTFTIVAAGALALGGCANQYGGLGGGGILGGILGGNDGYGDYNQSGSNDFERAAYTACGKEASRYGRVAIDRVQQTSREIVQVVGRIDTRDSSRDQFYCSFRNDGRNVDFQLR